MGFGGFGGIPRKPGGNHQPILGPIQGVQPGASQQKHKPELGAIKAIQTSTVKQKPVTLGPPTTWTPPRQEQVRVDEPLPYKLGPGAEFNVVILSKIAQNLKACLGALFHCEPDLPQERVIVVDDGAAQGCVRYFQKVRYIKGANPFVFARNANIGIKEAGGDVVMLNDDALLMTPGALTQMSRIVSGTAGLGLCSGALFSSTEAGNVNQGASVAGCIKRERKLLPFVCVYIPKRTLDTVGLLDERFTGYGYEDNDYCRRVSREGLAMGIFSGCIVDHGQKERSTFRVQENFSSLFAENKKKFNSKWGSHTPPPPIVTAPVATIPTPVPPRPVPPPVKPPAIPRLQQGKLKISCILTSYNRPRYIRQALKSLQDQTHQNFELLVFDDSSKMDIRPILKEFTLPVSKLVISKVTAVERRSINRLSVNINRGLAAASGDLVCFLADDDYYFPGWFEAAAKFFQENPGVEVGYGKLIYSKSSMMEFDSSEKMRWPGTVVDNPYGELDHNQVIHRRFRKPYQWPEDFKKISNPDAYYFREIAVTHPFYPISEYAAVKRRHHKNLQKTISDLTGGQAENLRE